MIEHELNARPLKHSEIGEKFVLHPSFKELVSLNNTIVIGPRGSGKTTMLKMLTPQALDHWEPNTKKEKDIKSKVSFIGIYIPMSRILQDELQERFDESSLASNDKENIIYEIYYLNIVESILDFVSFFIDKKNFDKDKIREISTLLNKVVGLEIEYCYKISTLLTGLSTAKREARQRLSLSKYSKAKNYRGEILTHIDPLTKAINELFEFSNEQKYALCFDELEIYNSRFTEEMVKNLRGGATNIILKLTLAPLHNMGMSSFIDPPFQIHDYNKIYLWPNESNDSTKNNQKDYYKFSEKLAEQTLFELKNEKLDLKKILGVFSYTNVFEYVKKTESVDNIFGGILLNKFTDEQLLNYIFLKTTEREPNFKVFLEKKGISIEKLKDRNRSRSSTIVRKIKEVIFNRIIVTKFVNNRIEYRPQKIPIQYHGKDTIIKIIDGNPRYLKKLMEYISKEIEYDRNGEPKKVPISKQASSLVKIKELYIQRIKAIPVANDRYNKKLLPFNIIKLIGEFFQNDLNIKSDWKTSSFCNWIKIPNNKRMMMGYEDSLKKLVNNGALLIIGENDLRESNTVLLKDLRLNYLLHIEYKIPIRKYYPTSFENIIKQDGVNLINNTKTLFDDI
ncbi:hypothetical protein [Aquimarina sp. Aq107]|uniref:ORC-CDC6 family AAA ATPase n=1 Tax=Aquimarina sp. Aq107 TaxID=1191912 RepID=UPI000D55C9BC|nr:hypothetical protein [Aquimarina sp. Aq107]